MHFYHISTDKQHFSVFAIFFDREVGGNVDNPFFTNLFKTWDN